MYACRSRCFPGRAIPREAKEEYRRFFPLKQVWKSPLPRPEPACGKRGKADVGREKRDSPGKLDRNMAAGYMLRRER